MVRCARWFGRPAADEECVSGVVTAWRRLRSILGVDGGVCGKVQGDGQAAFGSGVDLEAGSVGLGDVGDDGEAETEPVRAGGSVWGGALEGFDSGDPENKRFWISVMPAAEPLGRCSP